MRTRKFGIILVKLRLNLEKFLYKIWAELVSKRRWNKIERRTIALMLVILTALTIIGALTATSFATETTSDTTVDIESQTNEMPFLGGHRGGHRGGGLGGMTNIEVSTEYTENVNAILEADADVQTLIVEGYNVTSIRPIIKSLVEADGTVVMSATTAVVTLENGTSGYAVADVDVSQAEVTELVITNRTVIDKTSS